ncbi:MAG: hypothetical protein J7M21_05945 [Planctomycetes bacterium]|nr:hypothetical protein [Planctomycetota bacterium]
MKRFVGRQSGVALILVLTVVAAASVLGTAYVTITTVRLAGSRNLALATRAMYLAECGLEHALYLLRTGDESLAASSAGGVLGPFYADSTNDSYSFYAEQLGPLEYRLVARATCGGLTRTASTEVRLSSNYAERVAALGPVGYWRLGEKSGHVAADAVGRHDGRYKRGVELDEPGAICGDLDGAARFDGVDSHVDLGDFDVPGGELTMIAWFKVTRMDHPNARILCKADDSDKDEQYWTLRTIYKDGGPRLRYNLKAGGSTSTLTASGFMEVGRWTMAAATFDGWLMLLYQDGELKGWRWKLDDLNHGHAPVWIGGNPTDPESKPFCGLIDEVAVFGKSLEPGEIRSLFLARMAKVEILSWNN